MVTKEFLEGLKVGDYIKTDARYSSAVEKIVKVTATQIITKWGSKLEHRYTKTDGKKRGSGYIYSVYISTTPVSQAEKDHYEALAAEEVRRDKEREHVDKISKTAAEYMAKQLGMPLDKINFYVQSNDGLRTVSWTVKVEGIPEENISAMLAK